MNDYISQLYNILNTGQSPAVVMTVFLGACITVIILRMVVCSALRSTQFAVRLNAKDIRAKADISKLRGGLLKNLAAEYIRISDKNVSRIPTAVLVDRQLANMTLAGWRFINIMTFVEGIEGGLLIVGLILAVVFQDYMFLYGSLGIGSFFVIRIIAALFDFRSAYKILSSDLLLYIEREIGQFYASDSGSAVARLRVELAEVISRQTVSLQESINKLSAAMSGTVDKKLADVNASVVKAIQEWEAAISQAAAVQSGINDAADKLRGAIGGNNESIANQLSALTAATASFMAEQDAFLTQAKLVERNQHILESTYQSYEMTLQNLTQSLGDGLGAYLKMHAQSASQAVSDAMAANIEKMTQLLASAEAKLSVGKSND